MKHKLLISTLSLLLFSNLKAQESKTLTLQEAVNLTLGYNKTLKVNQVKIQEAAAAIQEAYEKKLPDAGVSGSWLYLPIQPSITMKTGSANGGSPKVSQVVYGMANVSVPVYTANRLKYGIESAQYLEQAVKLNADNDKEQIVLNTINACVNLFKAYTAIGLVKENLETAKQRVKDFTSLEKNGLLARNDLMKAELQASNIELSVLDAETNYKLACVNMNLMMGLPEQTILIPDKSGLALPATVKTLDEFKTDAFKNRKDAAGLVIKEKIAGLGIKSVKAGYYPSVALTGGYVAADIPKFLSVVNAVNIGVGIKYDIAALWKAKTKIQQANLNVQEVKLAAEMLNDNIKLQVNQAYQNYLLSQKKIEVYEKAVEQAEENYRITKNKYNNALATTTELLDADVALLQTKLGVTNAKADSFLAYNKLLQTTGTINY